MIDNCTMKWCTNFEFMLLTIGNCKQHFFLVFFLNTVDSHYLGPRESLEYFEISVPRHIRFEKLRKTINRTTTFNK